MNLTPIASNMTELTLGDKKVLFSYKTPVASYEKNLTGGFTYFKTNYKWSATTTRHINKWLKGNKAIELEQDHFNLLVE